MVGHPLHGQGPGGVSDPGGETSDVKYPTEGNGQDMEVHLVGGGKGSGGFPDNGEIRQLVP